MTKNFPHTHNGRRNIRKRFTRTHQNKGGILWITSSQQSAGLQTLVDVQVQTIKKGKKKFRGFQSRFHPSLKNSHACLSNCSSGPSAHSSLGLTRNLPAQLWRQVAKQKCPDPSLLVGLLTVSDFLLGSVATSYLRRSDATPSSGLVIGPSLLGESAVLRVNTARNTWDKGFFSHGQVHLNHQQLIRGLTEKKSFPKNRWLVINTSNQLLSQHEMRLKNLGMFPLPPAVFMTLLSPLEKKKKKRAFCWA